MTLESYARPGIWAPLAVAIGIGIYFIVGLDSGPDTTTPNRKIATADVTLTIFGENASAEVTSPLILEHDHTLVVALDFHFDPAKLRSFNVWLDAGGSHRVLRLSVPEGIRPGWAAKLGEPDSHHKLTLRYERDGLKLVVPGAYVYKMASGSFVMKLLAANREYTEAEVVALHRRDWVSDPDLLIGWSPEIAVFSSESDD